MCGLNSHGRCGIAQPQKIGADVGAEIPGQKGIFFCPGKDPVEQRSKQPGKLPGDPQLFRHFGIEPTLYDLVVVKANTSFRAPYSTFTDLIYYADTPGAGASNLRQLHWEHLPKHFYPFDLPDDYRPARASLAPRSKA